jgi:tight adherence protein C
MELGLAAISAVVIFLLLVSGGILLFHREGSTQQVSSVFGTPGEKKTLASRVQLATVSLGTAVGQLEGVMPKSQSEVSVVQQRLIRAGYRRENAVRIFYGAKVVTIVVFLILMFVTGLASHNIFIGGIAAVGLGFLAPDFWLGNRIKARQKRIRLGLPDVLDLLIVCVEAGLSLDQATQRTTEELRKSDSAISDELGVVVLEQRAGLPRAEAWRHFAERTDVQSVRNVVSMLVQSEQFGTSIAKTLRVHSQTLRTQRIQQVEEQAAKSSVKMLFPLVLFIFPAIFVVVLGPAAIVTMETLSKTFK